MSIGTDKRAGGPGGACVRAGVRAGGRVGGRVHVQVYVRVRTRIKKSARVFNVIVSRSIVPTRNLGTQQHAQWMDRSTFTGYKDGRMLYICISNLMPA